MRSRTRRQPLTGWGSTAGSVAVVSDADDHDAVVASIRGSVQRGLVARGGGSASGDCGRNGGGHAVGLTGPLASPRTIQLDWESRTVAVAGGALLSDLVPQLLRQGWILPVTPATTRATVAGCIATDAHGRNHADSGSFGCHVRRLDLIDGMGGHRELFPTGDTARQFWATVGGLGLTGVITGAVLDIAPVSSAWVAVDSYRCGQLDEVMTRMCADRGAFPHRLARLDPSAPRGELGRGVVTLARHAAVAELPSARRADALEFEHAATTTAMRLVPRRLLGPRTVRTFHEAWFRTYASEQHDQLQPIADFLYPDDARTGLADWYEAGNVVQYQFAVPDSAAQLIALALEHLADAGVPPLRAQLRRFGPADPAPLSFPAAGWTLDLHVSITTPDVAWVLDSMDERVAAAGGRVYLAKDDRLRPELLTAMYPGLSSWRAARDLLDPDRRLQSDLSRRVGL